MYVLRLSHEWYGNVWLNPPYASELITKFVDKFISEAESKDINQGVILVNNATETEWFSKLAEVADAVCFPKGRVKFYAPDGKIGAPLQGQAILYFGENANYFVDTFRLKHLDLKDKSDGRQTAFTGGREKMK